MKNKKIAIFLLFFFFFYHTSALVFLASPIVNSTIWAGRVLSNAGTIAKSHVWRAKTTFLVQAQNLLILIFAVPSR